jgi:hypothetical protein
MLSGLKREFVPASIIGVMEHVGLATSRPFRGYVICI